MWKYFGIDQKASDQAIQSVAPLQGLDNATLRDTRNPSNITREPNSELQYFNSNMALHCLNFAKSIPEGRFKRWDSSEYNAIHHFN